MAVQRDPETVIDMEGSETNKDIAATEDIETIIDMDEEEDTETIVTDMAKLRNRAKRIGSENNKNKNKKMDTAIDVEADKDVETAKNKTDEKGLGVLDDLKDHCIDCLESTSAHGFNHLVDKGDGSTGIGTRIVWSTAIFCAFFASIYYCVSSVQEAHRNPIATTVQYIPVQGIPFPAVTLEAGTTGFPLEHNILHQLTFDCSTSTGNDTLDCMNKTASARNISKPLTEALVNSMFRQIKDIIAVDETKRSDSNIRLLTCYYIFYTEVGLKFLNPVVESLSQPNDARRDQKVEEYLEIIVKFFKTPMDQLMPEMTTILQNYTVSRMTLTECERTYFDRLSIEAKAITLLTGKLKEDETQITLANWMVWQKTGDLNITAQEDFSKNIFDLQKEVSKAVEKTLTAGESELSDMAHLGQTEDSGSRKTKAKGYQEILQSAKYKMQPLRSPMTELSRVRDMQQSLQAINDTFGRNKPESFINYSPMLLHCHFHGEKDDSVCQSPTTTFTESGTGYTYNTRNFFQLYQKRPNTMTFCEEIVDRTDREMCLTDNNHHDKKPVSIKASGPNNALRFLLFTRQNGKFDWSLPKMAIHPSHSIGDTERNLIQPSAGTHTSVVLTPHVKTMDESLLERDRSVRGCHAQEKDRNPLRLFQNYTRENCEFECRLEKSTKKCGCIPWNYPKLDENVRTCSRGESSCFRKSMNDLKQEERCQDCIDECSRIDYEYTTQTKPLENICENNPEIYKAVAMVINEDIKNNFLPYDAAAQEMGPYSLLYETCNYYVQKNMALVDVYIGPASAVDIISWPRVTFTQEMSDIGGTLGLLTGTSFLTMFESVWWLFKTPAVIARGRRNRVDVANTDYNVQ